MSTWYVLISQAVVQALGVVVAPQCCHDSRRISLAMENLHVQVLVAALAVETLGDAILPRDGPTRYTAYGHLRRGRESALQQTHRNAIISLDT